MKQTTKNALKTMGIATVVGSIAGTAARLMMIAFDSYYPGWGDVFGMALIFVIIASLYVSLERGGLE